jgi:hypothetical protein
VASDEKRVGRFAGEVLRFATLAQDGYPHRIASLKVKRFGGQKRREPREVKSPTRKNGVWGTRHPASPAGKVYRRRFVSTRLAATLVADGAPCFDLCARPALVLKRDCSYISIHFSLEIAEISLPIASSGKSSGDSK